MENSVISKKVGMAVVVGEGEGCRGGCRVHSKAADFKILSLWAWFSWQQNNIASVECVYNVCV